MCLSSLTGFCTLFRTLVHVCMHIYLHMRTFCYCESNCCICLTSFCRRSSAWRRCWLNCCRCLTSFCLRSSAWPCCWSSTIRSCQKLHFICFVAILKVMYALAPKGAVFKVFLSHVGKTRLPAGVCAVVYLRIMHVYSSFGISIPNKPCDFVDGCSWQLESCVCMCQYVYTHSCVHSYKFAFKFGRLPYYDCNNLRKQTVTRSTLMLVEFSLCISLSRHHQNVLPPNCGWHHRFRAADDKSKRGWQWRHAGEIPN